MNAWMIEVRKEKRRRKFQGNEEEGRQEGTNERRKE